MQIQIIDVGTPNTHAAKNGRTYQSLEVTYKSGDGKVSSKKLMSFSNPSVFAHISKLSKGDTLDVVTQKDDAGYWQWTAIGSGEQQAVASSASSSGSSTTRITGSNYETKEERAARQILIVRQSSLSSAVATLTTGAKSPPTKEDIIELAKFYETFVFNKDSVINDSFENMEDDIPY